VKLSTLAQDNGLSGGLCPPSLKCNVLRGRKPSKGSEGLALADIPVNQEAPNCEVSLLHPGPVTGCRYS
jgi:hypothetical protein